MHTVMQLCEIFHSLQGEGPWLGMPAVFVRLSGCIKPYCPWCDTAYALGPGEKTSPEAIMARIRAYPCKRTVITGGEPFLQWKSGLEALHRLLWQDHYAIQYETSGKIPLPDIENAMIVCSPKYTEGHWRFTNSNIRKIDHFKFVIQDESAFDHVMRFIEANRIPPDRVFMMPLGDDRASQLASMPAVFNLCVRHGFRMTPRLHTLTFDNRKGI